MNIDKERAKACVGPGWASLIDEIYDILPDDAYILQVKEKFGGLRFYVSSGKADILDRIYEIENRSLAMCEMCGKPGRPTGKTWIITRCEEHKDVENKMLRV